MNFFLSFLQSEKKHPIPSYEFWEHYIKNGITEAGYRWAECPGADWALGLVPQNKGQFAKWKQETWEKTVNWLKKNPADVFLSYLYPQQVDASAIKEIQKLGIPCVNFFCDNIREFKKAPAEYDVFDLNWVPEYLAVKWYQDAGYPVLNLPMPMWVDPRLRVLKEETNKKITFIGSKDIQRKLLFEKIVRKHPELDLAIYGAGWSSAGTSSPKSAESYTLNKKLAFNLNFIRRYGITAYTRKMKQRSIDSDESVLIPKVNGLITFEEYNRLTAESMITLGVNRYPSYRFPLFQPDKYSRLRDIEAPMLGACYLTENTIGLEWLYDTDKEIAVYNNAEELIWKVRELQSDPAKRLNLKINGQKRALSTNSIPNSLNKIKWTLAL